MKRIINIVLLGLFISCQKEKITLGTNVSETFYVRNDGADMGVRVFGNTQSEIIILIGHGGPGGGALDYRTEYYRDKLESRFAIAYWDQRTTGVSQGGVNRANLKVEQFGKDMRAVVLTLKKRYGTDCKIFIYGHSWGGMVTSSFMTQGKNQTLVKGWIFLNATHDYLRNDELTRKIMLDSCDVEISAGRSVNDWKEIKDFATNNPASNNIEISKKYNELASNAEKLYAYRLSSGSSASADLLTLAIQNKFPLTVSYPDGVNNNNEEFYSDILQTSFTSRLKEVKLPALVMGGAYDFICPASLQTEFYQALGSTDKKLIIKKATAHSMEEEEAYIEAIIDFITSHL